MKIVFNGKSCIEIRDVTEGKWYDCFVVEKGEMCLDGVRCTEKSYLLRDDAGDLVHVHETRLSDFKVVSEQ